MEELETYQRRFSLYRLSPVLSFHLLFMNSVEKGRRSPNGLRAPKLHLTGSLFYPNESSSKKSSMRTWGHGNILLFGSN